MSDESKQSFFRQSGWMIFATLAGGVFMFAVHPVYIPFLGEAGYGNFLATLSLLTVMVIPGIGLQTVFAQQTAAAHSTEERARLTVATQTLLRWTFFLWVMMAGLTFIFRQKIIASLGMPSGLALMITIILGFAQLWTPIFSGILQGRQNFLWMGWASILNGLGRFISIGVIVVLLRRGATGAAFGALIGVYITFFITAWQSRAAWFQAKPTYTFETKKWLAAVVPLTLGLGAAQFISIADYFVVRDIFGTNQTGSYGFAGTLGRGILMFTAPLAAVMFPKVVSNFSQRKTSNVLMLTLLSTFILAALAAGGCTLFAFFGKQLLNGKLQNVAFIPKAIAAKLLQNKESARIIFELLPWFVWGMTPLTVANVLLGNLMARRSFKVVFYAVGTAVVYALVLRGFGTSFVRLAQILGIFNLWFLLLLLFFTWKEFRSESNFGAV
ncbi:MAG: hypothetical protein M3Y82_02010 [Verrucomicrobiota bacterium]|nr:hypothetical protein [Verrucomicrobiota bacterium]